MSRPKLINNFITDIYPSQVCNMCISMEIGLVDEGAHTSLITGALATTGDFIHEWGICSLCKKRKKVIRRNR